LISSRILGITLADFLSVGRGVREVKRAGSVVCDGSIARGIFVLMSVAMIDAGAIGVIEWQE
jgi:hypothetical protein